MRLRSCFFHEAWWSAEVMELLRRSSSGSTANAEEPSSSRPRRVTAPAANRSASATVVLPAPPCPTMATLRSFSTSSAGITVLPRPGSLVAFVDDAEPVQRQELVDRLDRGRLGRDQRRQPAGGEHACRGVVLLADALDQAVDQRGVAEDDARLDGVDGRPPDHAGGSHEL